MDGTRELLKERCKDLTKALARQRKQLTTRQERLAEVARDRLRMAPARLQKLKRQAHANAVAVARLESKLKTVARTKSSSWVPKARRQATNSASCCRPRTVSSASRSVCPIACLPACRWRGQVSGHRRCGLCLRPARIERALTDNVALSWRLHRDERGWRAFVAFSHPAAERSTLAVEHGAIGIDFNADHLAVTETDLYGNMPLLREDATSGQREATLSDALSQAVRLAREARKPLVAEDLDFSAKKKALGQVSAKEARMLSGLLYAKYRQQLAAKCHRTGVELILINPAYTSTIGAVKYAARRGWSVHAAAAGVIARRGQKLSERLPRAGTDVRVPVRGRHEVLRLPVRKDRDRDKAPGARFTQRTGVRCASNGSQPVVRLRG